MSFQIIDHGFDLILKAVYEKTGRVFWDVAVQITATRLAG